MRLIFSRKIRKMVEVGRYLIGYMQNENEDKSRGKVASKASPGN